MKKVEKILIPISIISLGLNILLIPYGGVLTVLTFSTLSTLYFYFGFALFNDIRLRKIFKKDSYKNISSLKILGAIGAGLALSMTTIGLMFKFQSWPGADFNLIVGLSGMFIVTSVAIIRYTQNKSDYYTKILKRMAIFGSLGIIVFLIPKTSWNKFEYRNYPDYVNAINNSIADPENKELQEKAEEERQNMYNKQGNE